MEYVSLFEYFEKKPAGKKLGGEVYIKAMDCGVRTELRSVDTIKYKGNVNLYPKAFLDLVFKK
jgi:hypothetical protein